MRIHEIFRPPTKEDAGEILLRAGYDQIGQGEAALVYHKPGAPNIVKLYQVSDLGFIHYLNLVTSVKNRHFPVIKGKPVQISSEYSAVQMEYLDQLTPQMEQQFRQIAWDQPDAVPGDLGVALRLIEEYVFRQSGVIPDISITNVMRRGATLVIVDPARTW